MDISHMKETLTARETSTTMRKNLSFTVSDFSNHESKNPCNCPLIDSILALKSS